MERLLEGVSLHRRPVEIGLIPFFVIFSIHFGAERWSVMRLVWLLLGVALLFLIPFLLWGGSMEDVFSLARVVSLLEGSGRWSWAAGVFLLMSDLLLPIPGTVVMSALGFVYGTAVGGLVAATGSFLSGLLGYALCRFFGRGTARRLLGKKELERGEQLFANVGGWIIVLSRWLPLLSEVIACTAGLIRMPARTFIFVLTCGSLPIGLLFAAVGHTGVVEPMWALLLSAVVPAVLWLIIRPIFKACASTK